MSMLIVLAALAALSLSCRHGDSCVDKDIAYCARIDSTLSLINDVDSLAMMASDYHKQGDAMGEMVALRLQGRRLRQLVRFNEAIAVLDRSLEIATELDDTICMAMALCDQGDVQRRLGEMSKANGFYYKALGLCEALENQELPEVVKVTAIALNSIANIEIDLCNFAAADSILRRSLAMEESLGRTKGIAVNYLDLGQVKIAIDELDSAWYYYHKSMDYHQQAGSKKGMAMCHFRYGELHEAENSFSHAIKEYTIAYDQLKETGDTWQWLRPCLALARMYILMGDEEKAHSYIDEAEVESHRIGSKVFQGEVSLIHYELSLLQGDSQEALQHFIYATAVHDSIYGLKMNDEMRAQRIAYQNSRRSGEVNVLNRDLDQMKRSRNTQTIFMILLSLMAATIIGTLVYAVRVRARTQRLMRQVEETRSLFFTNVVHQLRTPLSAIMGAIDSIISEVKANVNNNVYTESQLESGRIIDRQGKNLLTLVDSILQVGSVRSAITELDWRRGDVVTFMHMIVESFRERCLERHIELTYASRESEVDIDTVPRYLGTIVANLLENAINYSRDFCKITVTSQVEGGMFTICVADNGMGIDKNDLPHVFEPFYRSAEAEALVEGVGIGLTVVRDMAMAMGGVVSADSKKDYGSVFTVKLPCKRSKSVLQRFDDAMEPLVNKVRRQQQYRHGDLTPPEASQREGLPVVLVVEDHVDVARLVGLVLGDRYDVRYATDGEQGLSIAEDVKPALIITDVKMPLMDGVEMCRLLKRSPQLCHIPVIMLSARNADADRVRGIEAGADVYLVKPFVSEELSAWVVNLIENRRMLREVFADNQQTVEDNVIETECQQDDDAEFLEALTREVDKQFVEGGRVDLDKVAHTFKMGESQLKRKIQTLTGKNVAAYIIQLRMEKAMRLLQESAPETLISSIAEQCGFLDVAYFSRVFRQYYGMTPTQARNK